MSQNQPYLTHLHFGSSQETEIFFCRRFDGDIFGFHIKFDKIDIEFLHRSKSCPCIQVLVCELFKRKEEYM